MVYPHNNDLGNKKPEPPVEYWPIPKFDVKPLWNTPEEKADLYAKLYGGNVTTTDKTQSLLYKSVKEQFLNSYHGTSKPEPKLVEGTDYKFKYWDDKPGSPIPYKINTAELRFEIRGLFKKTHGVKYQIAIPPEGLTEGELRTFLMKNFQQMTEKIISDVKKEKGL